jgi:signal transduction histidine kinase
MEGEGEEALRTSLGHCLSPKNVQAAARLLKGLQEHLRQLLLDEKAIKGLLRSQSEEVRERFGRALDALLDNKVLLARYGARLVEQAETFAVLSERPAERQRAFLRRTAQDLQGFYQLIGEKGEEGPGLRPILSQALKTLSVASVLERAQETVDARAAHHHIRIVGPDHLNPYLRIAGDPAPLTQTLADLLGNAVDAVVEQITLAPRDYIGKVRLEVKEEDHLIIVRIADNGCGIPPDLLEPIQHKESVSTKGHGRGMGLVNARRTLERYPGGKFEITSPGVGQGAVVTLRLEKL